MSHDLTKNTAALALALCLCLSLTPEARAAGEAEDEFGELFSDLCQQYEAEPGDVYAGYLNLATGEEHYHQGDDYVIAGSMYKVPLCMIYAQRISSGELDWDDHYPNLRFEDARDAALIYSDNEMAGFLWEQLGGYTEFRRICTPYIGEDPDTVDAAYYENNLFTSRQLLSCLKTLYEGQDSFPGIIDTMKQADPERFFRYGETRYEIAQKYGYCHDDADVKVYMNCCGIAFTDEPIAIVMFTRDVFRAEELLGAYCTAMCDYAQRSAAMRQERQADAAEELTEGLTKELIPAPETTLASVPAETPAVTSPPQSAQSGRLEASPLVAVALVAVLSVCALAALALRRKRFNIKSFWLIISVSLAAVAMLLCVVGMSRGIIYARPDGDPQASAAEFFDALKAADYDRAYGLLRDYSNLGLENVPESEAGRLACDALRQSYDYELVGQCQVDKLEASQRVKLRYLDLSGIQDTVKSETMDELKKMVQTRSHSQVYDSNEQYLPEVAHEAYIKAVSTVMGEAEKYYAETEFDLTLSYVGGSWKIVANPTMLKALNGNAGY